MLNIDIKGHNNSSCASLSNLGCMQVGEEDLNGSNSFRSLEISSREVVILPNLLDVLFPLNSNASGGSSSNKRLIPALNINSGASPSSVKFDW